MDNFLELIEKIPQIKLIPIEDPELAKKVVLEISKQVNLDVFQKIEDIQFVSDLIVAALTLSPYIHIPIIKMVGKDPEKITLEDILQKYKELSTLDKELFVEMCLEAILIKTTLLKKIVNRFQQYINPNVAFDEFFDDDDSQGKHFH